MAGPNRINLTFQTSFQSAALIGLKQLARHLERDSYCWAYNHCGIPGPCCWMVILGAARKRCSGSWCDCREQPDVKTVPTLKGGVVQSIAVREGDKVKAGDLLITLQDTMRSSALTRYEPSTLRREPRRSPSR